MPGSVANAVASTVLPFSLCRAYSQQREYLALENEYADGASQVALRVSSSRKSWRIQKLLTPSELQTLRTFWDARKGPHQAFYFYDVFETSPKFSYDATGVATTGRYTVHFVGEWDQAASWPRGEVGIQLEQLA